MTIQLAIFATHPIQYYAPWYRKLAAENSLALKVYYAFLPSPEQQGVGFGVPFEWDIPLLEGYDWEVVPNVVKNPNLRNFFGVSTPTIREIFKKNRPDVVILTGWNSRALLEALWACMQLRIPRAVRGESNHKKPRSWRIRFFHRLLLSQYNAFLAIGKSNREFYLKNSIHANRIFDCPYFVENDRLRSQYEKIRSERDKIRSLWNIPPDHICFLYAGKLERKKHIMDLLVALGKARKRSRNAYLLVVGDGELMPEAQKFVAAQSLPVTFAGFLNQTEITKAYVVADCLVLPSDYGETWGLVVNEAMVCGLPAIVSDQTGCEPDLILEGETGTIFPFGDTNALCAKLLEFSSHPERLKKMGNKAQIHIGSYDVDQAVQGTLEAVQFLVSRPKSLNIFHSQMARV